MIFEYQGYISSIENAEANTRRVQETVSETLSTDLHWTCFVLRSLAVLVKISSMGSTACPYDHPGFRFIDSTRAATPKVFLSSLSLSLPLSPFSRGPIRSRVIRSANHSLKSQGPSQRLCPRSHRQITANHIILSADYFYHPPAPSYKTFGLLVVIAHNPSVIRV